MPPNMAVYNNKTSVQNQNNPNFSANGTPISSSGLMQNNPLVSHAEKAQENSGSFLPAALISAAGLFGINNFINNPLLTKDYNDTIFKKIETAVDDFAAKHKSKPAVQSISNFFGRINTAAKNRVEKSEILRTLFRKPSLGGPNVESQAAGARGHLSNRAIEIMKKYKADYKATTGKEFTAFDTILKKAEKDSYKHYDKIIKAIENAIKTGADPKKVISKKPWWGFGLVKNKSSLQEILNKAKLIDNYKLAGKKLGAKSAGYLMRATECLTNGMFGGKGQVLIQAFIIAQSLQEAKKAEKGEKVSSFMASLAELMAFFATMGIQMRVVNHLAGLKFIGMGQPEHKAYQKYMAIANKAAGVRDFTTYNKALYKIRHLKEAAKQNVKWYQKPVKWLGNILSYGRIRETMVPLKASKTATTFAKIPYGLKVGVGYAGRFALVAAVVMPFFSNIGKKLSYVVFGKPTKTIEREKAKEKEAENQEQSVQDTQTQIPTQTTETPAAPRPAIPPQSAKPGNLIDTMNTIHNNQNTQNPMGAQSMSESTPAAGSIKSPDAGIKRTYIPNPVLGPENNTNNTSASRSARIDAVLRQADLAEAMAQKYM